MKKEKNKYFKKWCRGWDEPVTHKDLVIILFVFALSFSIAYTISLNIFGIVS